MPVVDNTSTAVATGGVTSLTWSHITAGASRYMVVQVGTNGQLVTGVTYAGIAMTNLGSTQETPTGHRITLFGLVQPGTGTNNVVVTLAGSTPCVGGAISLTGVAQVSSTGVYAGTESTGTNPSVLVASDADELIVGGVVWNATTGAATSTPDASQTFRWKQETGSFVRGAGSTDPGAASVTFSYTMSVATNAAIAAVAIKPELTPAKGTLSRVIIPLSRYNPEDYAFIFDGWQRAPGFDAVFTPPNEFFCGQFLG